MTGTIVPSWSIFEVCEAWGVSDRAVAQLVRDGKVGYFRGRKRSIRFYPEHIAQLRELLEVKAQPVPVRLNTRRATPRRRTA